MVLRGIFSYLLPSNPRIATITSDTLPGRASGEPISAWDLLGVHKEYLFILGFKTGTIA
jgi:hypothetical protein